VVTPLVSKGPNKGRPNWRKMDQATERVVIITVAEHEAWKLEWERKTGNCAECVGTGITAWERLCRRCGGSGKALVSA
jgi:RecJ-like exonuclease